MRISCVSLDPKWEDIKSNLIQCTQARENFPEKNDRKNNFYKALY